MRSLQKRLLPSQLGLHECRESRDCTVPSSDNGWPVRPAFHVAPEQAPVLAVLPEGPKRRYRRVREMEFGVLKLRPQKQQVQGDCARVDLEKPR